MNQEIGERPEWFLPYCGMDYEQSSREGARLIAEAHESGEWHGILDRLMILRGQMRSLSGQMRGASQYVPARA